MNKSVCQMSNNTIGSNCVAKEVRKEIELMKADVEADISVVLPLLNVVVDPENPEIMIELDYETITQVVNNYIERYTIDPRITEVDYRLSTPQLCDEETTKNLKDALTGEKKEVVTSNKTVQVDNKAIVDDKVTLKFELSVEENVFLAESDKQDSSYMVRSQITESQLQSRSLDSTAKSIQKKSCDSTLDGGLIIQSAEQKLYWENPSTAQLYWENAQTATPQSPTTNQNKPSRGDEVVDQGLEVVKQVGTGIDTAMGGTILEKVNVGDNGRVYTNPHARGNQYYKIVGSVANNKIVKKIGIAGKAVAYGATVIQTGIDCVDEKTPEKKGKVIGASLGKVSAGTIAGTATSIATTAVLVTVTSAAGMATAPLTIVVIAGCSIMAGVAASTAVEKYGEDFGGTMGEKAVRLWQSIEK